MAASKGDEFKTLEQLYGQDPRERLFSHIDPITFEPIQRTIADHHEDIARYELDESVPEPIATQYEVARNIYLYAWHAYRFYMVAEHHALVSLEYAIKQKVGKNKIKKFGEKRRVGCGLAACLRYVIEKELVLNEDFPAWHRARIAHAESLFEIDLIKEMSEKGIDRIEYDLDDINVDDYPYDRDHLSILAETLPAIRNTHAHGTSMVHNSVLSLFETVSTIINRLFLDNKPIRI